MPKPPRRRRGERPPGRADRAPARGERSPGRGERPAARAEPAPASLDRPRTDLLYGRNPIHEALRAARRPVRRVWATPAAAREPWLDGVDVRVVEAAEVAERAGSDAHQGLVAEVGPYPYADEAALLAGPAPLVVALDEVQDPQNVGAIARTAEAVGATGLVIPRHRSAEVTAAVAKASAGAVEHLPIAQVRNLTDFLGDAKEAGCWVYGAAADGADYRTPDYHGGVVLVLGAEGKGLRPRVRDACDALVALPLRGKVASLNVSAAAAALLYMVVAARE